MAATADCRQTRENQTSCRRSTDYFSLKDSLILSLLLSALFVATINTIQIDATTIECGTVNLYREAILKGEGVIKDEWPFIVALYYSRKSTFFCGGTIISQKHILTAAHCVQRKGTIVPLSPDEIIVRLGAYNLTDRGEKDAIDRNVTAIHVHPDWKFNDERYDADLAILVLNENITYSNHIRPICMPPGKYLIDGLDGTVVGWGTTENRTAEGIPRKIKINALNDTYCYETDKDVSRYASERSFCGEGSGAPSTGDSGGGFLAVAGSGWVQFGTVSFVRPKGSGRDLTIAVYMKLTMLRDWIAATVKKSGGTISVATTKADLNCTYMYTDQAVYGCRLFDLNIRQENFVVENFTGPHLIYHGNEEVAEIVFESGVMASFPRGTGTIFKNLQSVVITANTRRMYLSRYEESDPAKRILFLELERNSLWDLSNLQSFDVTETDLKSLDAATFSKNCKLTSVKVRWCTLKSLPWNLLRNNLLLEHVSFDYNSIEFVDENAFETNVNLRAVSLKRNRLRYLSRNLFLKNADMQSIDLSNNLIRTIAEQTLAANSKLVSVNLASNKLEVLPKCLLQNLTFLKNFYANDNLLSEVDAQFFETNVAIEEIHLQSNHLTHIPATLFRNNSKLRNIQLGSNAIETIDGNLFEGNLLLHNVSLKSNLLISLPPNLFTNNVEIQFLNLGENLLETVDERTLETNARLLQVSFKDNFLTFLPEKLFRNNSLLQYVWFDKNFLVTLDENIFQANPVLFKVSFASNLLDHLPENLFRNNSRLLVVDFSQNFFTTLSENIFRHNAKLIKVSMREGSLQSLPRNLFRNNFRLQFIDLVANYLQFIETDFTMLKRLSIVNLNRNQCINIVYYDSTRALFRIDKAARRIENLTEFQDYVTTNCS